MQVCFYTELCVVFRFRVYLFVIICIRDVLCEILKQFMVETSDLYLLLFVNERLG